MLEIYGIALTPTITWQRKPQAVADQVNCDVILVVLYKLPMKSSRHCDNQH